MNDLFQNFSFIFTADNYKNLPASHDRSDSHGICLFWNILFAVKESFVGLNRSFSQIYAVSLVFKMVGWFIKTNMSIVTKPEDLDISWTDLVKQFVICLACFFSIWFCAVRNVCICMVDIYFVEQMGIHKIAVALFIRTSQSFIFIEIDSRYLRKIQVTVFVHFYQMFISSNRR